MTREEIIQGLQFTIDMFLFDPLTGEPITKPRNDMDKTTMDACKGAIELLQQQPCEDAWIIDSLKEFLGESYSVLTSNKKEFMSWLERLRWHVVRCDELATELRNYKKQIECEDAISRQAVLDVIEREQFKGDAISEIEKLPPVQPKYNTDEWCHDCSEYNQDKHCCPRYNKVIRYTIEEMKQCEDTISRKETLEALKQEEPFVWCDGADEIAAYYQWSSDVDTIKNMPPVQPKPKTGQWVLLDECSNSGYYCSECHKKLVKEGWSDTVKKIKYCPNCGAKMIDVPDVNDGKLSEIPTGSESEDKE